MSARYLPAGDRGLVVEFGETVSLEINNQVRALALGLKAAAIPGLIDVVPTYRSLGIEYDPQVLFFAEAERKVREVASTLDPGTLPAPKRVEIPTVYGGIYGPDLPFVAKHAGLSQAEVIRLHSQAVYHVYMIGFSAGFAYLGGLPEALHTPRLPTPRIKVPKGSVAIGGSQTGAYPAETPGGWRIIGRTYIDLFDPLQAIPTPMQPGDKVQFIPITEEEYLRAEGGEQRAESRGQEAESSEHPGGTRAESTPGVPGTSASARKPQAGGGRQGMSAERIAPSTGMEEVQPIGGGGARRSTLGAQGSIEVLRPGFLTTVQDRGRFGFQRFGVPVSGGVDEIALRTANVLVGNPQEAAALEMTALGPRVRFLADGLVALTGAEVQGDLDGRPVPWCQSFRVRAGQILDIGACTRGLRTYLAVAGGIEVPILLGSRATCLVATFGGFRGRALATGDVLAVGVSVSPLPPGERRLPKAWRPRLGTAVTLRVVLGPQEDAFTAKGRRTFLGSTYRVSSHADRMGYRLDGPVIVHRSSADIISDWVPLGGVQVPGDGKPIILLADRQTTGGYAKIATVIKPDLSLVAQLRPGDSLTFRSVNMWEAQEITRQIEADLQRLPMRLADSQDWEHADLAGEVPEGISLVEAEAAVQRAADPNAVRSPMAGKVVKVLVEKGRAVTQGQPLFVLQVMKMEIDITAPRTGLLVAVNVREGDAVGADDVMARVDAIP